MEFRKRFQGRILKINGTVRPSVAAGELAFGESLIVYKNAAADWRIISDNVEVRLHSLNSLGTEISESVSNWMKCRQFRTVGSLIRALSDSIKFGRVFVDENGEERPCASDEFRQWIRRNRDKILNLVQQKDSTDIFQLLESKYKDIAELLV